MKKANKYIIIVLLLSLYTSLFADEAENRKKFGLNEDMKIVYKLDNQDYIFPEWESSNAYIDFADDKNGIFLMYRYFAENENITIVSYNTKDGGYNWKMAQGGIVDSIGKSLTDMINPEKGVIFAQIGAIKKKGTENTSEFIRSNNGGITWHREEMPFVDIAFTSADHLVEINSDTIYMQYLNTVVKTKFGGEYGAEYWEEIPKPKNLFWYHFMDKAKTDNSLFIGYRRTGTVDPFRVLRSTDFGASWEDLPAPRMGNCAEFLDKDTWYFTYFNNFKPDPKCGILKVTNDGKDIDTIFTHRDYIDYYANIYLFGKNNETLVYSNTERCLVISRDSGKTFKYIIDPETVEEGDHYSIGWCNPDKLFVFSNHTGYLMMYSPSTSVNADIGKFNTKIYPNPVTNDRPIYISLENDKARNLNLKIFDMSGNLIDESQEMNVPKGYHTIDYLPRNFANGTYFIVIESNGEVITREKFIVK